jgi:hypothetical protein
MANRTAKIEGRVLRNLRRHGVTVSDVRSEDIYDEMENGINHIISEVNTDKIITLTLATNVDTYPLTTDNVEGDVLRKNVAAVKIVKLPSTWLYNFEVVSNKEFVEKVNANPTPTIIQPVIGTVIDGNLKIFPPPSSGDNGVELELFSYLSSSTQTINATTEPELPGVWDKAIELYVTSQFLSGKDRQQWLLEYNNELNRLRPLQHRKHFNLQRESIW